VPSTIVGVPFRQIFIVLLALIAIVGAAVFVLSWGDGGGIDAAPGVSLPENTTDAGTTTTTTSTTTTTIVPVTTSIPVECGADGDGTTTTSTTTTSTSTTTTEAVGEGAGEDDPNAPLLPTLGTNSSLSTVGLDQVTFGLTLNQARRAAGTEFNACAPVSNCYRVIPAVAPTGISFVVSDGTIERVDIVGDSPITTISGAGIGTTSERLDDLFGERLERVDLGNGVVDVIFVPVSENDAEFRVAFTTVDGVVETMRAGRLPLVLEADPCSA
jgi:hypothetical protein